MTAMPHTLRTNLLENPLGIGTPNPEFSWQVADSLSQRSWQIEVIGDGETTVWESGWTSGEHPFGVVYAGRSLASRSRFRWRVRIEDVEGTRSTWSEDASFETGVLDEDEWIAQWISDGPPPPKPLSTKARRPALYFHREVIIPAEVVRARAYASSLGWYRLHLNGTDVTGPALVPRWTPLDHVVEYQTYDVTELMTAGHNVVTLVVADGRYRGASGALNHRGVFGDRLAAFVQIEVELIDGTRHTISTDESWKVGYGSIRSADPKWGEHVDLRLLREDPTRPIRPTAVTVLPAHPRTLIAESVPRLTAIDRLAPVRISRTPSGAQLVDFGQNITGYVSTLLRGESGAHVSISYSEVLTPDGELDTHYLDVIGSPKEWYQKDEVTLAGTPHRYEPSFAIRGFQYVTIAGDAEPITAEDIEATVMSTDLAQRAWFDSSDTDLNAMWNNTLRGLRGNFLDTPTDCPTRERSGWTGDIQVFGPTASTLVDAGAYLRRYLENVALEQRPDGTIPDTIPAEASAYRTAGLLEKSASTAAGWGDVSVFLPWTLYRYYGDKRVLRAQYDSSKAWVEQLRRRAATRTRRTIRVGRRIGFDEKFIVDTGFHYGEWLRPGESMPGQIFHSTLTGRPVVATAYLAQSATLLARIARVLGEDADAEDYEKLADDVRRAWRRAFVRDGGRRIGSDKQDDYVRALAFHLIPEADQPAAVARLAELIEGADHHLGTGFLSTPLLLPTLVAHGRLDLALALLRQDTAPSWLSQIRKGASTWWESWEGYDAKGNARYSHNHYAFGSVASFLVEYVAGVRPDGPGWQSITVEPALDPSLSHASIRLQTPYGVIESRWERSDDETSLLLSLPAGVAAEIRLPGAPVQRIESAGTYRFRAASVSVAAEPGHA